MKSQNNSIKEHKYLRDGRSPIPLYDNTSRVMRANKGKDTKPEILLRKHLFHKGLRGYRIHYKFIPGRPDITFTKKKLAIFINGCFWHRCPICNLPLPKTNTEFWNNKFENNIQRDKNKIASLEELGWKVIVIWECQIRDDINKCYDLIYKLVISDIESTI